MKKHWIAFRLNIQSYFEYRANLFMQLVSNVLYFLGLIILWVAIYEGRDFVGNYSFNEMITYIIIGGIIGGYISFISIGDSIDNWINHGYLNVWLSKPYNVTHYLFFDDLGRRMTNIWLEAIAFLAIIIPFSNYLIFPHKLITYLIVVALMLLGGLLNYLLFYNLGILAFWMEQTWGARFALRMISTVASGSIIPLSLLPGLFGKIILFLPFSYMIYFPNQVFLERLTNSQVLKGIFCEAAWILGLYILSLFLWKKGLKSYTAKGG